MKPLARLAPSLAAALVSLAALVPPLAQAQALPGATAQGYAWADFMIGCTTCPHLPITLSGQPVQDAGGPASAHIEYSGTPVRTAEFADYTLAGGVSYAGSASFEGALSTPLLRALASTDNEQAFIIGSPVVPVGIDGYQASVDVSTQQLYQYLGSQPTSYTFHFTIDGAVSNDQSSVFGAASVYRGPELDLETGAVDFGSAYFQGTGVNDPPSPFAGAFSVTIDVAPGDSFWLRAQLGVLATMTYSSADVTVDAWNTMRVSAITGGDTGLLAVSAVPEPPALLLLAAGLLMLGWAKALRRNAER